MAAATSPMPQAGMARQIMRVHCIKLPIQYVILCYLHSKNRVPLCLHIGTGYFVMMRLIGLRLALVAAAFTAGGGGVALIGASVSALGAGLIALALGLVILAHETRPPAGAAMIAASLTAVGGLAGMIASLDAAAPAFLLMFAFGALIATLAIGPARQRAAC